MQIKMANENVENESQLQLISMRDGNVSNTATPRYLIYKLKKNFFFSNKFNF